MAQREGSSSKDKGENYVKQGIPTDDELELLGKKIERKWNKLGRRLGIEDAKLQEICHAHNLLSEKGYYMLLHWKQKQGSDATYQVLCEALQHELIQRQDLVEQFCYINQEPHKRCEEGKSKIVDKLEEVEDKIRNDIEQFNKKLNTFMAQREGSSSKDKAETRDDLKQMRSEIQNISEKLNSQMSQREETVNEENARGNLEQIKVEIRNIIEKLDTLINQLPPVNKKPRMEDVFDPTELINGIRQLYKTQHEWLAPFPWCEEFHLHLDNIYTRLKVISRKKERGTATDNTVDMSEIFKAHEECSQPRTVLIEGTPGMGKTTYCKKLVYDWATGKQEAEDGFPKFEIVLLLRCRDMKSADLWEAIDDQLLPLDVKEDERERFFDFIRQNQSNVLLILDGLDEAPSNKLPLFSEILKGRVLPNCRLVATARHEAGVKVRIHCDTLLEIKGFTEEDVQNFIVKYFKTGDEDLARKLLDELRYDKNLKMLAKNPLNTALLCLFCEDREGKFPKNRGQLFKEVVQCILRRYRKKEGLPETEDDLLEVYKVQLEHLGWIAFEGLRKDCLDFEESKLANHFVLRRFGFLSVQPGGSKLRPCCYYSFLHKSFQEWFAAFYLCCQLVEGKISPDKLLNKLDFDEGDHDVDKEGFLEVLHFALYMLAARCEELAVTLIQSMATRVKDRPSYPQGWFFLAMCCIKEFEGNNSSFYAKLTHCFGSSLKCRSLDLNYNEIVDIAFLAEALKVNTTVNSIKQNSALTRLSFYTGENGAAHLADALKVNTTLTELHLYDNRIGDQGAAHFAEALKVNKTLTKLDLDAIEEDFDDGDDRGDIGEDGGAELADALKVNTTLTELNLSCNSIGDRGAARFAEALRVNKTLTKLDLYNSGIGEDGGADLADALKVNKSVTELNLSRNSIGDRGAARFAEALGVNKSLTKLDLHACNIGKDGGADLAYVLKANTTLTELNLSRNSIGDQGAARFAEALGVNKTLTKLDLYNSGIGEDGGADLAYALKANTTLTELNLSSNRSGDQGAARFAEALRVNKTLTKLNLFSWDIGKDGGTDLADALKVNTTLTELNLSINSIGDQGAARFAEALQVNKTLTKMDLSYCQIGENGFADLADALKVNKSVTELDLSYNSIEDRGTACFAEALKVNKTLTKLDLHSCDINVDGAADLADALKANTTLTELNLYNNGIGDRGAVRFAEALRFNKTLTKLDLKQNGIGYSGATRYTYPLRITNMDGFASLVDALQQNTTLVKLDLSPWHSHHLDPADFDDPRDKAVVTELLRLIRDGRVICDHW